MNAKNNRRVMALLFLLLLVATAWAIAGATGNRADELSIRWWTADGGGGQSSGGGYSLRGTAGQPDAGRLSGGEFAIVGGFWTSPAEQGINELFLPVVTR